VALLFYSEDDDPAAWGEALRRRLPDLDFRVWPEAGDPEDIDAALVWLPPSGMLAGLPRLKAVFSLAAGVDAMLRDPTLPDLPLCRMVDRSLTTTMGEYVLACVLWYHRSFDRYEAQQREARWQLHLPSPPEATVVGIMGMGELGAHVAGVLREQGFGVRGWSRTLKRVEGVTSFAGPEQLAEFLQPVGILVCLLPLTAETENMLDARLFGLLPRGARLIQVARGRHLVDEDLIAALNSGQLGHATLDVMRQEPLPERHPFWRHPQIRLTPHSASYSQPESGAEPVAENLRRLREGRPLLHVVDRRRGY
jgi:glyoxylate/hydroxypyruvate reductase A